MKLTNQLLDMMCDQAIARAQSTKDTFKDVDCDDLTKINALRVLDRIEAEVRGYVLFYEEHRKLWRGYAKYLANKEDRKFAHLKPSWIEFLATLLEYLSNHLSFIDQKINTVDLHVCVFQNILCVRKAHKDEYEERYTQYIQRILG